MTLNAQQELNDLLLNREAGYPLWNESAIAAAEQRIAELQRELNSATAASGAPAPPSPGSVALLLKAMIVLAAAGIGFVVWRASRTGENETEADIGPQNFEDWNSSE
jgi:hypothetical protein